MRVRRVYFARIAGTVSPVKIGCSTDVGKRLKSLSLNDARAELLADLPGGFETEARFHALFLDHHDQGEWFRWCPEMEATIGAICEGRFDVATLPPKTRLPRKAVEFTPERRAAMRLSCEVRRTGRHSGWTFNERGLTPRLVAGDEDLARRIREYLADPQMHSHRWLYSDTWARWFRETPHRARPESLAA